MNIRRYCWRIGVFIGITLFSCPPAVAAAARVIYSPDGKIAITVYTDAPLGYSIAVDGQPVLLRSGLGLELAGNVKLGEKPTVQSEERRSADNHWENNFGKNRNVRDHFNELDLTLKEGERTFGVVARAYDDGVGLRMVLPRQPGMDSFVVMRDATEFTFAGDDQVWAGWNNPEGPSRPEGGFVGSQEWRYLPAKLSTLNPNFKYGLPFLVQTPAAYVAITESDLLDWAGMWLVPKAGAKNTLEVQLAPPLPAQPWPSREPSATNEVEAQSAPPVGEVQEGLVVAKTPHNSP
jgi:alpha-glucosidase